MTPTRRQIEACRVLVVGDAMLDRYWFGSVEQISREAPVPVVRVAREEERPGGAANAVLNVRALGAGATLLTVAGTDAAAARLRALVEASGAAWAACEERALPTTVKLRIIGRAQQLLRADFVEGQPSAAALEQLTHAFANALPQHDAVLFSDYGRGTLAQIPALIALARAAGKPVLVDPRGHDFARYAGASLITPNRAELEQVVGAWHSEPDLAARAEALRHAHSLQALLLTRADEGMSLFDSAGALHQPATAREVFDVTGAGDTVAAVMAVLLACGLPARAAVPHANRAGGIVVGRFGTASVGYDELFA